MILAIRKHPIYRGFILVALMGCIIGIFYLFEDVGPRLVDYDDSIQYWAAGRLMISGENPYSAELVLQIRNQAGSLTEYPSNAIAMMLYPPWILPFILPFGAFDITFSRLLWLISNIILILISVNILWDLYGGPKKFRYLSYIVVITFQPTIFVLGMGHITTLILLAVVGFLYFIRNARSNYWNGFLAGVCASLVLFKPQLLYLFLFALLLWIIDNKYWIVLFGGLTFLALLSAISLIINPAVYSQYWGALTNYSYGTWITPTIGSLLRWIFGWDREWLQILPVAFGLTWFIYYWKRNHKSWDWLEEMPLLLLVCVITSPYIWTYDMIILLIPIISILAKLSRIQLNWYLIAIITIYFALNISALVLHRYMPDNFFFWFAPVILILYLIAKKLIREENEVQYAADLKSVSSGH